MKNLLIFATFGTILATSTTLFALDSNQAQGPHAIFTPADIKWTPAPNSLPQGAQVSILEGNPVEKGLFTMRIKMPANYRIPPHWHPVVEHVTVISGTFYMGMGDRLDEKKATQMPPGSFAYMPIAMHHYAFTHEPVVIQLHGNGPWGITYVNSKDDPRNH
ncbi:cupin domain-containing protein [Legionella sp. CNM-1927-20]|uniref:cupin domain-containing protein n=1 Tax=Legionella sp. CNM-1927-20 TaxID=3422221 RepID=UPI00403B0F9F